MAKKKLIPRKPPQNMIGDVEVECLSPEPDDKGGGHACVSVGGQSLYHARERISELERAETEIVEAGRALRDGWTQQLGQFPAIIASLHKALNRWDKAVALYDAIQMKGRKDAEAKKKHDG